MKSGFLLCAFIAAVLVAGDTRAEPLLFESDSVMEITIPVDFRSLCRPRETEDCDFISSVLEYQDVEGVNHSIPIEIKTRGGWRSLTKNCSAPLLWIRFSEMDTTGTPFQEQSLLPLTTHCGKGLSLESAGTRERRSSFEQYLLKEYLGHRLYEFFTSASVKSRLVRISYPKPDKSGRTLQNYAFFTEHFDTLATRNDAERLPRGSFDYKQLDNHAADVLALFQFMIGNTDWSIVRERNTILISEAGGKQIPVPYDLDMSGLVDAHYAGPAPGLPIDTVRDRYYLGFCHPGVDWDALFAEFHGQQQAILAMIDTVPGLDKKSIKSTKRFLEKFFSILNSDEEREEHIEQACQPWPPSPIDHTTPFDNR